LVHTLLTVHNPLCCILQNTKQLKKSTIKQFDLFYRPSFHTLTSYFFKPNPIVYIVVVFQAVSLDLQKTLTGSEILSKLYRNI